MLFLIFHLALCVAYFLHDSVDIFISCDNRPTLRSMHDCEGLQPVTCESCCNYVFNLQSLSFLFPIGFEMYFILYWLFIFRPINCSPRGPGLTNIVPLRPSNRLGLTNKSIESFVGLTKLQRVRKKRGIARVVNFSEPKYIGPHHY